MAASLAAAVTATLFLLVSPFGTSDRPGTPSSRELRGTGGLAAPVVLEPTDGADIVVDELHIRWAAVPRALFYEVHVVAADGEPIWEATLEATTAGPPSGLGPGAGETCFLWVRAFLPDGSSTKSDVVGFRLSEE